MANSWEDPQMSYECDREAELESLRAENERLKQVIRPFVALANKCLEGDRDFVANPLRAMFEDARAALEGK